MKNKEIQELMIFMRENGVVRLDLKRGKNHLIMEQEVIKGDQVVFMKNDEQSIPKNGSFDDVKRVMAVDGQVNSSSDHSNDVYLVKSPLIGTFYEAAEPEAPPFVKINDVVKEGDTLCIVEAMKSMNEIKADVGGTVIEISGENGKLVEYDSILFKIKT